MPQVQHRQLFELAEIAGADSKWCEPENHSDRVAVAGAMAPFAVASAGLDGGRFDLLARSAGRLCGAPACEARGDSDSAEDERATEERRGRYGFAE